LHKASRPSPKAHALSDLWIKRIRYDDASDPIIDAQVTEFLIMDGEASRPNGPLLHVEGFESRDRVRSQRSLISLGPRHALATRIGATRSCRRDNLRHESKVRDRFSPLA
jgi:hypothetical protein